MTLKLIYFFNLFSMTFVLSLNLLSSLHNKMRILISQVAEYNRNFLIQFNLDITNSIRRASILSSDMTMICYFNITITISIIAEPTFSRVLKIFIIHFCCHKFFVKMFFHDFNRVLALFDHTINKTGNSIFT